MWKTPDYNVIALETSGRLFDTLVDTPVDISQGHT